MTSRPVRFAGYFLAACVGLSGGLAATVLATKGVIRLLNSIPYFAAHGEGFLGFPSHPIAWALAVLPLSIGGTWGSLVLAGWIPLAACGRRKDRSRALKRGAWAYLGVSFMAWIAAKIFPAIDAGFVLCVAGISWCGFWARDARALPPPEVHG